MPPTCRPECCCHDFAARIEEQNRIIADLIRQRDALQLLQATVLTDVDS